MLREENAFARIASRRTDELPRIFIAGTGRSGTWLLYRVLETSRLVHTFPAEMRFLVDNDGLMDLVDALTIRYSVVKAREALYRFERLMKYDLAGSHTARYGRFDLPGWLGRDYYAERLEQFCAALVACSYPGKAWQVERQQEGRLLSLARKWDMRRKGKSAHDVVPSRSTLKVVKYFPNRQQMLSLAATFVDDIFLHAARAHGKETWCEKTPQNLLHLDFLWELFPESAVIHIKRDPRGVALSLTKQPWAPTDLHAVCLFLRGVYDRWFELKKDLDLGNRRYLEIKLESFAASPSDSVERIADLCMVPADLGPLPDIDPGKVNYWRKALSSQDLKVIEDCLGPQIQQMGYE